MCPDRYYTGTPAPDATNLSVSEQLYPYLRVFASLTCSLILVSTY